MNEPYEYSIIEPLFSENFLDKKLENFFVLLDAKRGYGTPVIKNLETHGGNGQFIIEVELEEEAHCAQQKMISRCIAALNTNSAGLTFEWDDSSAHMPCIFNVSIIDQVSFDNFIVELEKEKDALSALQFVIEQKLAANNKDHLARLAQIVLNELRVAREFGFRVNFLAYAIKKTLNAPSVQNLQHLNETLQYIRLGRKKPRLSILGGVIAFLGVACFVLAITLVLTNLNLLVGLSLPLLGLGLLALGFAMIYFAREKGLKSSVYQFFKEVSKVEHDVFQEAENENLIPCNNFCDN